MSGTKDVIGRVVEVVMERPAHGGECVGRVDGRVVFVGGVIPGERVRVRVTQGTETSSFWRGELVEVLEPSEHRVHVSWAQARRDGVGGADLAHVELAYQREWKRQVVADQMARLGGVQFDGDVEAAPWEIHPDNDQPGWGWRTRFEVVANDKGRAGMFRPRSHDVVPLTHMPLATAQAQELAQVQGVWSRQWEPHMRLEVVAPTDGPGVVLGNGEPLRKGHVDVRPNARRFVTEIVHAYGRPYRYRVAANGFWQVHRDAPEVLVTAVLDALGDGFEGGRILDAYCGSGLFTVPLAAMAGEDGEVVAIEGDARAVKDARRNVMNNLDPDIAQKVRFHQGSVGDVLAHLQGVPSVDAVVLDPPRVGAGVHVIDALVALSPQTMVYVACDPAALARDTALVGERGYQLTSMRAFDLFPMTHHVECVAVFHRRS